MPRIRSLRPPDLDAEQRVLYDQIAGGERAVGRQSFRLTNEDGSLTGPFNVFLHAPEVGAALSRLGEAIRFRATLSDRIRELAILAVAGHRNSAYERHAHEAVGRAVGLTDREMAAAVELDVLDLDDPDEAAAYAFCRQALLDRVVSDDVYDAAHERLGERRLVELTALIGYYDALALLLSAFEIGVPEPPTSTETER